MGKVVKFLKTIRNNWKKSAFALAAFSYGVNYAKTSFESKQLMKEYCHLASKYGDIVQPVAKPFRHVTVILNPASNKRKAKNLFEKYCAPLLHLAGLAVNIVTTEYAGQAKDIFEKLNSETDVIVVAGGDGTLSETVTGLLRRAQDNGEALKNLPLAVLPLGRTNSISSVLTGNKELVKSLADATMAVIDGNVVPMDLIKVEALEENSTSKPIYGLARVEWGSFRDARAKRDKYWYFDGFRDYASILFSKAQEATWNCSFTEPCSGCSTCVKPVENKKKWWHSFVPGKPAPGLDYSKITNPNCGVTTEKEFSCVDFSIETCTISPDPKEKGEAPHLKLKIGAPELSKFAFVAEGWRRIKGENPLQVQVLPVRELYLTFLSENKDEWFSIDSEDFEVKPFKVTILPKILQVFRPRSSGYAIGN